MATADVPTDVVPRGQIHGQARLILSVTQNRKTCLFFKKKANIYSFLIDFLEREEGREREAPIGCLLPAPAGVEPATPHVPWTGIEPAASRRGDDSQPPSPTGRSDGQPLKAGGLVSVSTLQVT